MKAEASDGFETLIWSMSQVPKCFDRPGIKTGLLMGGDRVASRTGPTPMRRSGSHLNGFALHSRQNCGR